MRTWPTYRRCLRKTCKLRIYQYLMYTVDFSLKTHAQCLVYLRFHCHRQRCSNRQWWEARGNRSDTVQTSCHVNSASVVVNNFSLWQLPSDSRRYILSCSCCSSHLITRHLHVPRRRRLRTLARWRLRRPSLFRAGCFLGFDSWGCRAHGEDPAWSYYWVGPDLTYPLHPPTTTHTVWLMATLTYWNTKWYSVEITHSTA